MTMASTVPSTVTPKATFYGMVRDLIADITYKPGWVVGLRDDGRYYVQVTFFSHCVNSGQWSPQLSGKAYLSEHMCKQEVVGVLAGLIERAEIHEMREFFKYKGKAIFNPHIDPDALASVADKLSTRT